MTQEQTQILKRLKGELEYGDNTIIADRIQFTPGYVGMCLNPKNDSYNEKVVEAALALLGERKNRQKEILEKLENL